MFDLLFVAQSAPSTQSITLLQLVVGFVSVIVTVVLATAGLAWRAGRTLATKEDLKPMEGMVTKDDLDAFKAENERAHQGIIESVKENHRRFDAVDTKLSSVAKEVAFTAGRQYERDHGRRSESSSYAGMSEHSVSHVAEYRSVRMDEWFNNPAWEVLQLALILFSSPYGISSQRLARLQFGSNRIVRKQSSELCNHQYRLAKGSGCESRVFPISQVSGTTVDGAGRRVQPAVRRSGARPETDLDVRFRDCRR